MSAIATQGELQEVVGWLSRHAGFPAYRLPGDAETMLCVAALASSQSDDPRARFGLQRRDPAQTAALRTHGLRRSQVHYKCDNSAKV